VDAEGKRLTQKLAKASLRRGLFVWLIFFGIASKRERLTPLCSLDAAYHQAGHESKK
jgi:hypothetical protein